jgi:hypothetical protein
MVSGSPAAGGHGHPRRPSAPPMRTHPHVSRDAGNVRSLVTSTQPERPSCAFSRDRQTWPPNPMSRSGPRTITLPPRLPSPVERELRASFTRPDHAAGLRLWECETAMRGFGRGRRPARDAPSHPRRRPVSRLDTWPLPWFRSTLVRVRLGHPTPGRPSLSAGRVPPRALPCVDLPRCTPLHMQRCRGCGADPAHL